jgi:endonuclease/exonuclease/phosphatase family metal-dependent hydrolase
MALMLMALLVAVGLQVLRVLFPLAFDLSESAGSINAGLFVFAVFAVSPFLAAITDRLGRTSSRIALLGGTFAARLAIQFVHPIPLWLATLGTALFLGALTLEIHERRTRAAGAFATVIGLILGMSLDTALRTAFWTWDLAWQEDLAPVALTIVLCVAGGGLLALDLRRPRTRTSTAMYGTLFCLGPYLMLQALFLQSPGFIASQSGAPLPAAAALVLAGNAVAIAWVAWLGPHRLGRVATLSAGAALVVVGWLLRAIDGSGIGLVVLVGTPLSAGFLFEALHRRDEEVGQSVWWSVSAMSIALESFLLLAFAYQVHYDIPLPASNAWLPPLAALLLVGPVVVRRSSGEREPTGSWRLALIPVLLLLVPLVPTLTRDDAVVAVDEGLRILDYNLHMAVNLDGQVDLETLARTIEEQEPDVVVLQEVGRGWVTNGMTDIAEWMSARLEMPYAYGPAADRQFGNAVLSRAPISDQTTGLLGQWDGTMNRGWVRADIDVGDGTMAVIGTHLAHLEEDTPTRLRQIDVLLADAWRGDAPAVIAGDINDFPDSDEFAAFVTAGFVSAQDEAGQGELPTSWQDGTRIDYIFVTPDARLLGFVRPYSEASDHLPLVVTVYA